MKTRCTLKSAVGTVTKSTDTGSTGTGGATAHDWTLLQRRSSFW